MNVKMTLCAYWSVTLNLLTRRHLSCLYLSEPGVYVFFSYETIHVVGLNKFMDVSLHESLSDPTYLTGMT